MDTDPHRRALKDRAERGDAEACLALYAIYARGQGVERNVRRALGYLRQAAGAGLAEAQFELGRAIVADDPAASLAWTRRAADAGHVRACAALGMRLLRGFHAPLDLAAAFPYLERAAAAGDADAVAGLASARRRLALEVRGEEAALRELVAELGLAAHEAAILGLRAPSIRLVAGQEGGAAVPVGASRLGGEPDLPDDVPWPTREGRPLAFLAQVDLAAVAVLDEERALPRAGLLAFFFDEARAFEGREADPSRARVVLAPAGRPLRRRPAPPDGRAFDPCALTAFRELTLPFARTALVRSLGLGDEDAGRYHDLTCAAASDLRRGPTADGRVHRMLGHADAIQGDLARRLVDDLGGADRERPTDALEAEARAWRLLLQVDSESAAGMMWGDLGRLFFLIREDALAAARFDEVRAVVQSG